MAYDVLSTGELIPSGLGAKTPVQRRPFVAKHNSSAKCPFCNEPIFKGDLVIYDEDGVNLQHSECQNEAEDSGTLAGFRALPSAEDFELEEVEHVEPLQRPICPSCFTELPTSRVCGVC